MTEPRELTRDALNELSSVLARLAPDAIETIAGELLEAGRIVCHGLGREGLMLRACCMRLMHLGLDAHVAGDVTAPPVGPGDLLLASSGPGDLTMVRATIGLAKNAGARVVLITAQPDGPDSAGADRVVVVPAQTMADDIGSRSVLPMGTAFEIAMLIVLDLVAVRILERSGQTLDQIRARHTNLE